MLIELNVEALLRLWSGIQRNHYLFTLTLMKRTEKDLGTKNNKDISIFLVYDIKINYIITNIYVPAIISVPKVIHFYDFVANMPIADRLFIDLLETLICRFRSFPLWLDFWLYYGG